VGIQCGRAQAPLFPKLRRGHACSDNRQVAQVRERFLRANLGTRISSPRPSLAALDLSPSILTRSPPPLSLAGHSVESCSTSSLADAHTGRASPGCGASTATSPGTPTRSAGCSHNKASARTHPPQTLGRAQLQPVDGVAQQAAPKMLRHDHVSIDAQGETAAGAFQNFHKQVVDRRRSEIRSPPIAGEGHEVRLPGLLKALEAVRHNEDAIGIHLPVQ